MGPMCDGSNNHLAQFSSDITDGISIFSSQRDSISLGFCYVQFIPIGVNTLKVATGISSLVFRVTTEG